MTETLAALLRHEADRHEPPLIFGPALRARAGGRRRRVVPFTLAAVAAAAVVVAALVLVPAVSDHQSIPPADQLTSWPARGDLAVDTTLASEAMQTWDAAPLVPSELPHQDMQVLYAGTTLAGRVVVLTGRNALGHQRWAILNEDATSTTPYRHRLRLVLDKPIDLPHTHQLSWNGERPTPRPTHDGLFVLIAPPGSSGLAWRVGRAHGSFSLADDGAAAEVFRAAGVEDMLVSWRRDGRSHHEKGSKVWWGRASIAYQEDPAARAHLTASNDCADVGGGVMSCTATAGDGVGSVNPTVPDTLAQPYVTEGTWPEYQNEAELAWLDSTARGEASWSSGSHWSGLLPDGTGGLLESGNVGRGLELVLYADHPSGHGGRLVVIRRVTGKIPVLTAVVQGEHHPWLMAPAVDGWQVDVREGSGPWVRLKQGKGVRYAALTGHGRVQVRLISPNGMIGNASAPDGQ